MKRTLLFAALAALLLAGCARAEPRQEPAPPKGTDRRDSVPAGTVLRYQLSGGIAGHADEILVDEELRARYVVFDKPRLEWELEGEEASELTRTLERGEPFEDRSGQARGVADGMSMALFFAGRGQEDLRADVGRLARRLLEHASAVAEVTRHPVVVVGEIRVSKGSDEPQMLVKDVLKVNLVEGRLRSGERLSFRHPPSSTQPEGDAVWGLWLEGDGGRHRGLIESWRRAPLELKLDVQRAIAADAADGGPSGR